MVVATSIYILELASLVELALGIGAVEEEPFNFIRGVERVTLFIKLLVGKLLQDAADVRRVGSALLLDDIAEYQNFARPEEIRWGPVERSPVNSQPQIALALRGKTADRRSVKSQVVPALQQELLVVIEHMQTAFQIAEHHRHSLDSLLVGQVLQPLFTNGFGIDALLPLLFRRKIQLFQ